MEPEAQNERQLANERTTYAQPEAKLPEVKDVFVQVCRHLLALLVFSDTQGSDHPVPRAGSSTDQSLGLALDPPSPWSPLHYIMCMLRPLYRCCLWRSAGARSRSLSRLKSSLAVSALGLLAASAEPVSGLPAASSSVFACCCCCLRRRNHAFLLLFVT